MYRFFDNRTKHAIADVVALRKESIDLSQTTSHSTPLRPGKRRGFVGTYNDALAPTASSGMTNGVGQSGPHGSDAPKS